MLKNPGSLTEEEKEALAYVEKVLGEEKYIELKEEALGENQNLSQFMNLIGMNAQSSVTYIIDPKTGKAIDISNIDKDTLNRINYLADELKWFDKYPNSQITDKDSIMSWKLHSRDYFERELAKEITNITSGKYKRWQEIKSRLYQGWDGALEGIGGYTETGLGYGILKAGLGLTIFSSIPYFSGTPSNKTTNTISKVSGTGMIAGGGYLATEGISNIIEAKDKLNYAFTGDEISPYNPLRDFVYKKSFGDKGEEYFNKVAIGTGAFCIYKDFETLHNIANTKDTVKVFPRPQHIVKAEQLNLPVETITKQVVTNAVVTTTDTVRVVDKSTTTPMILYHKVTEHPLINTLDFTKNSFYTGVDFRNTKCTYNSIVSSSGPIKK